MILWLCYRKLSNPLLLEPRQPPTVERRVQDVDRQTQVTDLVAFISTPSNWLLPVAVITLFAVFREALVEYFELLTGFASNIFDSLTGK